MSRLDELRARRNLLQSELNNVDKELARAHAEEASERFWRHVFVTAHDARVHMAVSWGRPDVGVHLRLDVTNPPRGVTLLALPSDWGEWRVIPCDTSCYVTLSIERVEPVSVGKVRDEVKTLAARARALGARDVRLCETVHACAAYLNTVTNMIADLRKEEL